MERSVPAMQQTSATPAMEANYVQTNIPIKNTIHNTQGRRPTVIVYQKVSPESVVVPIVSSIIGFPILALLVICCLRKRAKMARERARRRNCGSGSVGLSLVQLGGGRNSRQSLARSRERPSLDLDTVLEERSDVEQTQTELMTPDREERLQLGKLLSQPARYFIENSR